MKRICIFFMSFMLIICLTGCNKIKSEEDKKMFNDYFINLDNEQGYVNAEYYLSFTKNDIDYTYKYSCEFKDDGSIIILNIVEHKQKFICYTFYNDTLLIQEFDDWPNTSNSNLLNEQESFISREDFLETYEIIKKPKYNLNFSYADYYRVRISNMDEDSWEHHFKFDKEYLYKIQIFGLNLNLYNCNVLFSTLETEKSPEEIPFIKLIGYENDVEYKLYITISK